jgi:HD-like signal output (HDOD) protein
VVSLLEKDPVIAAHVIKVANSPVYSPAGNIKNLKHASIRLGTNLLSEIALSVSLQSGIFILKGYHSLMKEILKHTMATSLFAKELYGLASVDFDLLYLSALFSTIGMPTVVYHIDEFQKKNKLSINEEVVNSLINKYHIECAIKILNKWSIDKDIIYVSTSFSDKQKVDKLYLECGLLRIAQSFAIWLFDEEYEIEDILNSNELVELNIHPENLISILKNKTWIKERVVELTKY